MNDQSTEDRVAKGLEIFPFPNLRQGQRAFIEEIADALEERQHFVAHVPSGVGKRAASLSVAVPYAMEHGLTLIYVTSSSTHHRGIMETLRLIKQTIPNLVAVDIRTKKSMCPYGDQWECLDSEYCRVNNHLRSCVRLENFDLETYRRMKSELPRASDLVEMAEEVQMCPHNSALDIAGEANVVVCDPSYIFSEDGCWLLPRIGKDLEDVILIVDEAHELPERILRVSRKEVTVEDVKMAAADLEAMRPRAARALSHFAMVLEQQLPYCEDGDELELDPTGLTDLLQDSVRSQVPSLRTSSNLLDILDLSQGRLQARGCEPTHLRNVTTFLKAWTRTDTPMVHTFVARPGERVLRVQPLDHSEITADIFHRLHASILMSNCMLTTEMYSDVLHIPSKRVRLKRFPSPYPGSNRLVLLVDDVTTIMKQRSDQMFDLTALHISEAASVIPGNVVALFPSYSLLDAVANHLERFPVPRRLIREEKGASYMDLEEVVANLQDEGDTLVLGIQGGSLMERLKKDHGTVHGLIIVGIPMAPPTLTNKALQRSMNERFGGLKGYKYSTLSPAMTRVFNGIGRCINGPGHVGVVLLMDQRFRQDRFSCMIPSEFKPVETKDIKQDCKSFFLRHGMSGEDRIAGH